MHAFRISNFTDFNIVIPNYLMKFTKMLYTSSCNANLLVKALEEIGVMSYLKEARAKQADIIAKSKFLHHRQASSQKNQLTKPNNQPIKQTNSSEFLNGELCFRQ